MHPKNMTIEELVFEASRRDGASLMMDEALAYWLGVKLEECTDELSTDGQWTVILGYPDYLTDDETTVYRAQVLADTPKQALYKARMDANDDNPGSEVNPADFDLLCLFQGWHDDMAYLA